MPWAFVGPRLTAPRTPGSPTPELLIQKPVLPSPPVMPMNAKL